MSRDGVPVEDVSVRWAPRHRRPGGRWPRLLSWALAGLVATTSLIVLQWDSAHHALADEQTASQDQLRTGWDKSEPGLSGSAVSSSNFGQLFATTVNGQVYAQPLVLGSTVVVSTENDYVYGLDVATGAIKWTDNFGPAWPASTTGCADLTPNLGNTSTGVYDPVSGMVYLTTKVNDGPDANHPNWYLHAVNPVTGAEQAGWPVKIVGTPANDPAHPFQAASVNQRPGLLLLDGAVYLAFGSQCDFGSYVGWVAGVNTSTRAINMWSDESGPSSYLAGIWQGGGGLVSDGSGRIILATGNGLTAPDAPGSNPPQQLSQSVVRLGVDANGVLSAKDFFSPANAATLDTNDQDLGSGGPVGLPSPYFGTAANPNLMVEIGKEGRLYLLDRDHLGGKAQGPNRTDDVLQELGPYQGVWGHPAVYGGEGGYVYAVQNSSTMLAFKYGVDGSGKPALSLAGNSAEKFWYTAGSPIVTSDGVNPGSALVWAVNVDGPTGANGRLCAYNAIPVNNQLNLIRCFPVGTAVKFATPASSGGRIYVGTRDGRVYGFGQPAASALSAPQTAFGNVSVGQTGTATVTATATRPVTVTAVSTSAPFSATPPTLPVTLNAGQSISVPVSFAPTAPGSATGTLQFTINDAGATGSFGAALQGNGIKAGFSAAAATVDFGDIAVGATKTLSATFVNSGSANETVTAATGAAAPFSSGTLPAVGAVVAPGQNVAVPVTFTPTAAANYTSTVTLSGANGTATVTLLGHAVVGNPQLTITPTSLAFGTVAVGSSATQTVTVANTGNLNVTITKAAPPALPFVVNTPLPEGQVLTPDQQVSIQVTFAPTAVGSFSSSYVITADDGKGAHTISVTGNSVNPTGGTPLPTIGGGSWVLNGSAATSGTNLTLTTAQPSVTGSALFSSPLPSDGLRASFTATIGGGTGADGMTFAMLDASANTPNSIGVGGGGMGFSGLPGVAVVLDTCKNAGDPSGNFIALSTSGTGDTLNYLATATNIPNLRSGSHTVLVTVVGSTVTVSVDGVQQLSASVNMPPSILAGFTGATGGLTDNHSVSNVDIASGSTLLPQPGTGWRLNGAAATNGAGVVLTPATNEQSGSALYSQPVATNGLNASFTLTSNGGTGADGSTFAMLDPAQASAQSVGAAGSGLGFAKLAGVAVCFVTFPEDGIGSGFVAIATSTAGGPLTIVANSTNIPNLRSQSRRIAVAVSGTTVSVSIDGTRVLSAQAPTLTPAALVGFTAGTGAVTDVHTVSDASIVTGGRIVPAPPIPGWTGNGSTTTNGGTIQLTAATADQTGTAIYGTPVATAALDAKFTIQIGGGSGADGMTFMLLNPVSASPTSIGIGGGGLGYSGLPGVAVSFVTFAQTGDPSNNYVGISTAGNGRALTYVARATNVPNLRTGTHAVEVQVTSAGHLVVKMDGTQVLDQAVAVPANALVGFSGATGAVTDVHAVSNISITY
jgi:Abnormal spindle-like microcephaly-assoc'd, ASPM-SPD-2-Hydin